MSSITELFVIFLILLMPFMVLFVIGLGSMIICHEICLRKNEPDKIALGFAKLNKEVTG